MVEQAKLVSRIVCISSPARPSKYLRCGSAKPCTPLHSSVSAFLAKKHTLRPAVIGVGHLPGDDAHVSTLTPELMSRHTGETQGGLPLRAAAAGRRWCSIAGRGVASWSRAADKAERRLAALRRSSKMPLTKLGDRCLQSARETSPPHAELQ